MSKQYLIPGIGTKPYSSSDDIVCFIAQRRTCDIIVITDASKKECKRITSTKNIGVYAKDIDGTSLWHTHRKYIVNKNHIEALVERNTLKMKFHVPECIKINRTELRKLKNGTL